MVAFDRQLYPSGVFSVGNDMESSVSCLIVGNLIRIIVRGRIQAESNYTAGKPVSDLFQMLDLLIDDERTVRRKKLGKTAERMSDIVKIFEEIQVIRVNIEDDSDLWEKMKKAVGVLAGLCHKKLGAAYPDVSSDCFQNAAH